MNQGRTKSVRQGGGGKVLGGDLITPPLHVIGHMKNSVFVGVLTLNAIICVVVVHHVTIAAIGHGLWKQFWPLVIGCVLRTAGSSLER